MSYVLDRYEFKFLISASQQETLLNSLPPHIQPDRNAGPDARYRIYSLYFDTEARDCYWEKLQGLRSRRKLRVRVYESESASSGTSFVEVKHKLDGRGVKRRIKAPLDVALRIAHGEPVDIPLSRAEAQTCEEIRLLVKTRGFRPVCCLSYDRRAFADTQSDLRITFDEDVRYRTYGFDHPDRGEFPNALLAPGESIMEVKVTGAVPLWLASQLSRAGCVAQGKSKYCDALLDGDEVLQSLASPNSNQIPGTANAAILSPA
jgi:SPX domain-containing protein involved in vacuolar polyphosphate accumulation